MHVRSRSTPYNAVSGGKIRKNRLGGFCFSRWVQQDLKRSLRDLQRRTEKMRRAAVALITGDAELRPRFARLLSMPGIGEVSALNLLGEDKIRNREQL